MKQPKEEHKIVYEKQKEKRIRISRKIIKIYMNTVSSKNIETNKGFLINNVTIAGTDITSSDGKNMIGNEYGITNAFNEHYINTDEKAVAKSL